MKAVLLTILMSVSFKECYSLKSNCFSNYQCKFVLKPSNVVSATHKLIDGKLRYELSYFRDTNDVFASNYAINQDNIISSKLYMHDSIINLDSTYFINIKDRVGGLSFWDGDTSICNMKQYLIKNDTINIYKGTFFCNGRNCNSYVVMVQSMKRNLCLFFYFSGIINFNQVELKIKREKILLTIENEIQRYPKIRELEIF